MLTDPTQGKRRLADQTPRFDTLAGQLAGLERLFATFRLNGTSQAVYVGTRPALDALLRTAEQGSITFYVNPLSRTQETS